MIKHNENNNLGRFSISLDSDEYLAILRALYWYEDKLTNMQRATERDNLEWDIVIALRHQLKTALKKDAFI
jgi:hypothetical protein